MANEMSWKECVDEGVITQSVPDEERSNQMLMMANLRLKFWDKKVADEFIVLKVEAYYDIIKELLFAHLYKKIKDFDFETKKIDELRKVRNEINYRGLTIKKDYLERNELEFKNIIKRLKEELG